MPKYKSNFINRIEPDKENFQLSGLSYRFRNEGEKAIIDIDGAIGFDWEKWYEDKEQDTTATFIKQKLRSITANKIEVNVNSLGGDINDGLMINDLLKEHPSEVVTITRGLTASAGTIVMQGASAGKRLMSSNAKILVHNGLGFLFGWYNYNDLEPISDDLKKITDTIIDLYAKNGGKDRKEYEDLMNAFNGRGRWISATEALEFGLIDAIYEPGEEEEEDTQAVVNQNKELFKNQLELLKMKNLQALTLI
jgi:ATP-dependent Clp protease protease subunit